MLQAYPGRDPLMDVLKGKISIRRFRVMVEHLPIGNPAFREVGSAWTDQEWLLYTIAADTRLHREHFVNVNREKGTPAYEFPEIPNPNTSKTKELRPSVNEAERADLMRVLSRSDPR